MKELNDGTKVPARCWYYLLEFGDQDNWDTLNILYKCRKLEELTKSQFYNYLAVAVAADQRQFA